MSTFAELRRRLLLVVWAVAVASVLGLVSNPPGATTDPDPDPPVVGDGGGGEADGDDGDDPVAEPAPDELVEATVGYVYDGDTVKVSIIGGWTRNVRMLNIDAPEIEHPDQPGECLGEEATAYLTELLPRGTRVQLAYDTFRMDDYQRDLAVIVKDGVNINAEVVRAGFASAIVVRDNRLYYPQMQAAEQEAAAAGRGIHGSACR
jgi:micrococcal nuclease